MTDNTASKKKTLEERAAAAPTELHERFAHWLFIQTGVKVDLKTVQLATSMRMDFQSSEDNQAVLQAKKQTAAQKEADRIAKRKAALEKELAKLSSAVEVPAEPVAEEAPVEEAKEAPETPATESDEGPEMLKELLSIPAEKVQAETAPKPRSRRTRVSKAAAEADGS